MLRPAGEELGPRVGPRRFVVADALEQGRHAPTRREQPALKPLPRRRTTVRPAAGTVPLELRPRLGPVERDQVIEEGHDHALVEQGVLELVRVAPQAAVARAFTGAPVQQRPGLLEGLGEPIADDTHIPRTTRHPVVEDDLPLFGAVDLELANEPADLALLRMRDGVGRIDQGGLQARVENVGGVVDLTAVEPRALTGRRGVGIPLLGTQLCPRPLQEPRGSLEPKHEHVGVELVAQVEALGLPATDLAPIVEDLVVLELVLVGRRMPVAALRANPKSPGPIVIEAPVDDHHLAAPMIGQRHPRNLKRIPCPWLRQQIAARAVVGPPPVLLVGPDQVGAFGHIGRGRQQQPVLG